MTGPHGRLRVSGLLAVLLALLVACADVPPTTVAAPDVPAPLPEPSPTPTPPVAVPGGIGTQLLVTSTGGVLLAGSDGVFGQVVTPEAGVRFAVDDGQGGVVLEIDGQGVLWVPAVGRPVRLVAGPGITLHDAAVLLGQVHVAYSSLDADTGRATAWLLPVEGDAFQLGTPDAPVVAMSIGADLVVVSRQDQATEQVSAWTEIWDGPASTISVPGLPGRAERCAPAEVAACPWMVAVSADGDYFAVVTDRRDAEADPALGIAALDVTVLARAGDEPGSTISVTEGFVGGVRVAEGRLVINVTVFDEGRLVPGPALVADLVDVDVDAEAVGVAVAGPAWAPRTPVVWAREAPLGLDDIIAHFAP